MMRDAQQVFEFFKVRLAMSTQRRSQLNGLRPKKTTRARLPSGGRVALVVLSLARRTCAHRSHRRKIGTSRATMAKDTASSCKIRARATRTSLPPNRSASGSLRVPQEFLKGLEVVQFSQMTRKKQSFPCYGMQWGSTLYLYPLEESLEEWFTHPAADRRW